MIGAMAELPPVAALTVLEALLVIELASLEALLIAELAELLKLAAADVLLPAEETADDRAELIEEDTAA